MNALEREIARLIELDGPLTVERYMSMCLSHPEHGYYMGRVPFGRDGDFITAPDVSQMFGELVGVWCAQAWSDMGQPDPVHVVELGPGRGTLMADLARAAKVLPGFDAAARYHLVETSPKLREVQGETLAHLDPVPRWHAHLSEVPAGPSIIIANEFFDALPVRQFEKRDGAWSERVVGLDEDGSLAAGLVPLSGGPTGLERFADAEDGSVLEQSPARAGYAELLAQRAGTDPLYALIIDYGHERTSLGDTLQAVRQHEYCDILEEPGVCDLTAHVDFETLCASARNAGASAFGVMTQRQFLMQLGIEARAERLKRDADEAAVRDVDQALARLIDCDQMGNLFKVCAIGSACLPAPYPFIPESA